MTDLVAELLANGPFERAAAPFRLVEVAGPDAGEFLHRLSTQDVLGLAAGQLRPVAFLDAKGKLLVTCLVFRLGDAFFLELAAEQEERLLALLERYHFAEKLTVARHAAESREVVALGGAGAPAARAWRADDAIVVAYERRGVLFLRRHGGAGAALFRAADLSGLPGPPKPMPEGLAECLRMMSGLVRVGIETEATTLGLEADLDDHCSTTKGCYTGQEIVARIHTYGHVNRKLCLLHLAAGPAITAPVPLHEPDDQLAVGRVMRALPVPDHSLRVGLGYLPQDFQAVGTKLTLADGSAVTVVGFQPLPT